MKKSRRWQATSQNIEGVQAVDRSDGYTLLELLIVIGIIGLLAAIATPQLMRVFEHSKAKAAEIQLTSLSGALDIYRLDVGHYPTSAQGLKALLTRPQGTTGWAGPYLTRRDGLIDPWGRPYLYHLQSSTNPVIETLGADGKAGGDQENRDLTNHSD